MVRPKLAEGEPSVAEAAPLGIDPSSSEGCGEHSVDEADEDDESV